MSDAELGYRLGCAPDLVARARASLGMEPRPLPPHNARFTREERLLLWSEPLPGGHRRWLGRVTNHGVPVIDNVSALRIAFRIEHGREPEGPVFRDCRRGWCVSAPHLTDQVLRAARDGVA
ncbi:hypothetical protein [Streptomyces sp. Act143]|uniref:hypothetical protein n=1 Tax=Streptomyces sp. Act143 TaxID=2200760 RepID=UPI0011B6B5E7|nr:hypothetical protein [Streptomyces sp. Act143]